MNRAIVTSFDGNYFEYAQVFVRSFVENYNGPDVLDLICLVPLDLIDREREFTEQIDSDKLRISFRGSQKFEELVKTGNGTFHELEYISENAMQRVFLASTLHDYDEVIYIDPDTLILRDVHPLLSYPLRNKLMAAQEPDNLNLKTFNDPDRPYFNNGVFITSLNWWREAQLEQKMVDWLMQHGPTECIEQDLMNRFMIDVWAPLPTSFNFRMGYVGVPLYDKCQPLVIHFVGHIKPWNLPLEIEPLKYEKLWMRAHRRLKNYKNGLHSVEVAAKEESK